MHAMTSSSSAIHYRSRVQVGTAPLEGVGGIARGTRGVPYYAEAYLVRSTGRDNSVAQDTG